MSKGSGVYQNGNDYELVGVAGHEKENKDQMYVMLRNQKEKKWVQFQFGLNPKVEELDLDNEGKLVDELLTFALYTKVDKKPIKGPLKGK